MADWSLPTLASLYTEFHDTLKARDNDALIWLDGSTSTNLPSGAKRWNSTNSYFEKFNGSAWSPLVAKYMINVDQVDGCTVNDAGSTTSDLWTASKITTALSTKLDSASYTASDVLAKLLTVDGSGSGIDADLLDGQTGSYYNDGNNIVWSATPTAGKFNTSTTAPTGGTRLNYEGYFYPSWINLTSSGDTATTASHYYVETGSDGFVRPKTLANVRAEIVTKAAIEAVLTGAITTHTHANTTTLASLGVTATAAELNKLDGCTATVTELNYVDGVTSAIQTQLNAKAPLASPALTGTPTAPTAAVGTNTTQLATTAFVLANSLQSITHTAGTKLEAQNTGATSSRSTTLTKIKEISIGAGGTVTTYFGASSSFTGSARIYVNGVAKGTLRSLAAGGAAVYFTENITVAAGDLIQVYGSVSNSAGTVNITGFKIMVSTPITSNATL